MGRLGGGFTRRVRREEEGWGGLWYKSELHVVPHFFGRKLGTLKRASGFKRYSLSFLMERSRNAPTWSRGLLDLYISALPGGGRGGERETEGGCLSVHTSGPPTPR